MRVWRSNETNETKSTKLPGRSTRWKVKLYPTAVGGTLKPNPEKNEKQQFVRSFGAYDGLSGWRERELAGRQSLTKRKPRVALHEQSKRRTPGTILDDDDFVSSPKSKRPTGPLRVPGRCGHVRILVQSSCCLTMLPHHVPRNSKM